MSSSTGVALVEVAFAGAAIETVATVFVVGVAVTLIADNLVTV